jgi:ABC-2 type transport system ATP-binding protein
MSEPAISVRGLHKRYGRQEAVRGIDLEVAPGEIFSLLGANGAGKTTTIEILEGYRSRSAGSVSVLGVDPALPVRAWRERIGIVIQESGVNPLLTVREVLTMYAQFYARPRDVGATIALVGLDSAERKRAGRLSGGQRRRLEVALALIGDPELIFLDEPTTGFDPAARRDAWAMIGELQALGTTVFLTTHSMDEAQALADRVAILRDGRIAAEGPPSALAARADRRSRVSFTPSPRADSRTLSAVAGCEVTVSAEGAAELRTANPQRTLHQLTGWAEATGADLEALEVRRASLEDAFLSLTRTASDA